MNYRGFPKTICTSVNHVVCHGIPNDKVLKTGDIVNIDVTVIQDGFHGDTSRMYYVGKPARAGAAAVRDLREAMWARHRAGAARRAPRRHRPRHPDLRRRHSNFSVVREYCGHGIGRIYHEDPQVLHYGEPGTGDELKARHDLHHRTDDQRRQAPRAAAGDGWTVVTKDHSLSAQWEHTVLVTETGYEVLTLGAADRIAPARHLTFDGVRSTRTSRRPKPRSPRSTPWPLLRPPARAAR